jgi:hypothetical protein
MNFLMTWLKIRIPNNRVLLSVHVVLSIIMIFIMILVLIQMVCIYLILSWSI